MVRIGVGRWYLEGPLLLPDNVRLQGAGMDRTAIYFAFRNASNTPSTMIGAVHGTRPGDQIYPRARFGVEDLAIYIVSHFESVIDISPYTDGVRIQRIRLRANMFFGADWWGSASHPAGADGGRGVPWIFSGGGRNP